MQAVRRRWQPLVLAALATVLVAGLVGAMSARGNGDDQEIRFPMVRSAAAANGGCLANASAKVKVENQPRYESIAWYLETLGMGSELEAVFERINAIPKLYAT